MFRLIRQPHPFVSGKGPVGCIYRYIRLAGMRALQGCVAPVKRKVAASRECGRLWTAVGSPRRAPRRFLRELAPCLTAVWRR